MVILIAGASCVGKTFIAQKLLEKYNRVVRKLQF